MATDTHARRVKELASEVKRRRGWAASDPTQAEPLVDALNELGALRILARDWSGATDAQDALTRANRLVAEHGAVGPFTPVDDGVRFFTATTHLAAVQAGLGLAPAGAQMAQALRGWTGLLPHVDLAPYVGARTACWLLSAQARGAWAAGDLGAANAFADAAVDRAREGLPVDGSDAPARVEALLLAADLRWTSGIEADAVGLTREAADAAWAVAAPVLDARTQPSRAWVERVLPPLDRARRDLADRLLATGNAAAGLAVRSEFADLLAQHAQRLGPLAKDALARTLADLAHDLVRLERSDEALDAAGRAASVAAELAASESKAGDHVGAQFAAVTELARVLLRRGEAAEAAEALASLLDRFTSLRSPAGHEAALARAVLTRADAELALGDAEASERSLREFHALAEGLRSGADATLFAGVDAAEHARNRARGAVGRSSLPIPHWQPLSDADALAAATRAPLPVPGAEAPVQEASASAPGVDRPATPPTPAPAVTQDAPAPSSHHTGPTPPTPQPAGPTLTVAPDDTFAPHPPTPHRDAAPGTATSQATDAHPDSGPAAPHDVGATAQVDASLRPAGATGEGDLGTPSGASTPTEDLTAPGVGSAEDAVDTDPSAVEAARSAVAAAQSSGNRRDVLAATIDLVTALRPLTDADPTTWGPSLVAALEDLGEARFRTGDWWGSRAPKKEAKALAKQLGL